LLTFIAVDFYRWYALALTNILMAVAMIAIADQSFRDTLATKLYENQTLVLINIVISYISGAIAIHNPTVANRLFFMQDFVVSLFAPFGITL
jgi:hypothetical protein